MFFRRRESAVDDEIVSNENIEELIDEAEDLLEVEAILCW
jgi:hypothetical protein